MKTLLLIIVLMMVVDPVYGYYLNGTIYNNSAGLNGTLINYGNNDTYSDSNGFYSMPNMSTGTWIINYSNNPEFYSNSTNVVISGDTVNNVNMTLKPTGTITGRVCSYPGCEIVQAITTVVTSNRIKWFF